MAVFFCAAFDVSQLRVEEVDTVFVDAFGLTFNVATRAAWRLASIANKLAAFFEAGRKFFI
mgnify:CR=1 FL=1